MRQLLGSIGLLLLIVSTVAAQPDDRYTLRTESGAAGVGEAVEIAVTLDATTGMNGAANPLQSWSYGLCHDPLVASVASVLDGATTATVNGGGPPDFNVITTNPATGDGFTVAVVVNVLLQQQLSPGLGYELNVATYEINTVEQSSCLRFCDNIGDPPAATLVGEVGGMQVRPVEVPGFLGLECELRFVRGDGNVDGTVDLADPIFNLAFLFSQGEQRCADAQDTNDDGQVDVADPVYNLTFQFQLGAPPTAPFPACGPDPTFDGLGCDFSPICPQDPLP